MISVKKVTSEYNKLIQDVKTNKFYTEVDLTNRINCYICGCGHITKTKDIDAGVTPFMFDCEKCGEMAQSTFFTDVAFHKKHTVEWYRPSLKEVLEMRKKCSPGLDHVLNGGLEPRKIESS